MKRNPLFLVVGTMRFELMTSTVQGIYPDFFQGFHPIFFIINLHEIIP